MLISYLRKPNRLLVSITPQSREKSLDSIFLMTILSWAWVPPMPPSTSQVSTIIAFQWERERCTPPYLRTSSLTPQRTVQESKNTLASWKKSMTRGKSGRRGWWWRRGRERREGGRAVLWCLCVYVAYRLNAGVWRDRIMDCVETAMIPGQPESEIKRLLNFVVVGGGPSGVEFTAGEWDYDRYTCGRCVYAHLSA